MERKHKQFRQVNILSGPKTYDYTLTAEQRAILREQARIRRLTEETKNLIENRKREIRSLIAAADKLIEKTETIYRETGIIKDISPYKEILLRAMNTVNEALSLNNMELSHLQRVSENLLKSGSELRNIRPELENIADEAEKSFEDDVQSAIIESFSANYSYNNYETENEDVNNTSKINFSDKINSAFRHIEYLHLTEELTKRVKAAKEKFKSINDYTFQKNFYSMTIIPLVNECKKYDSMYSEKYPLFCELSAKYKALSSEANIKVKQYVFSQQSINMLKEDIAILESQLNNALEQEYISKCVDEAMQEMGYKLIGEREGTRKSGKKFKNELYLFEEGTAVNVTFADNGQITMELGGIDHTDRIPTDFESRQLSENMQSFCDDYHEISEYLKKKGIEMKKVSHLPPDSQYAQIINVSNYSLIQNVSDYTEKKSRSDTFSKKSVHKNF